MANRFYIGKREQFDLDGSLDEWIAEKVPPPPEGTRCEDDQHMGEGDEDWDEEADSFLRAKATTFLYRIEDGHVCYTYVCDECGERGDPEYLADQEYPVTESGYAVAPRHCA